MFKRHVTETLSAYCDDELPTAEETRRVAEHLLGCQRCRKEYEEIKSARAALGNITRRAAPETLWRDVETLIDRGGQSNATAARTDWPGYVSALSSSWRRFAAAGLAALLLLACGAATFYYFAAPDSPAERARVDLPHEPPREESNRAEQITSAPVADPIDVERSAQPGAGGENGDEAPARKNREASVARAPAPRGASWAVSTLGGEPQIGGHRQSRAARIAVGEWLETDDRSRARIEVADIGHVEVEPNSRLRLVATRASEHRLALDRGRMSALIFAPPRLFFVDTPSGVAVDYGCAYTLEVDPAGRGRLRVTAGWVAFELNGREAKVPAGAECATRPGTGPGTPYFADAAPDLRDALRRFDFEDGGEVALRAVLAAARPRDSLTLWHLLSRARREERQLVYEKLAALVAPPAQATRDGLLRLDRKMLELWRDELESVWF